jgi:inorganic triphosphatase YgiF
VTVPVEIELKLALPKAAAGLLKRHPLLATAAPTRQRLRSIYFDTPELALREKKCALRLRRAGRVWLQTFKHGMPAKGGLHDRIEHEFQVRGPALDLAPLVDTPGASLLSRKRIAGRLIPVFETVFVRTAWRVVDEDGNVIEVALDQGDVWSAGRRTPLSEVELELLSGDPAALFRIAASLQETVPLLPDDVSKAERGYRLYRDEELAPPAKTVPVALAASMTPRAAMRAVIGGCLAQLQANADGARIGADPEYVHQMRVALRRLRAVLGLFAPKVAGEESPHAGLRAALRELAAELGTARDWDVFVEETLAPLCAAFPDHEGAARLLGRARTQREAAAQKVRATLESPAYARLLLRLSAETALEKEDQEAASDAPRDQLRVLARAVLGKRYRRVARDGAHLAAADDQARHRLRIAAKKLRYAAEFFAALFDADAVFHYTRTLSNVQDLLGRMNDIVTARGLLGGLDPDGPSRLLAEAWLAAKADDALRAMPQAFARVDAAGKFWKRD